MKNTDQHGLSAYKTALPMSELLQALGLEGPDGSGKILCPFHDESVPSCHVYEYRLHCFGCGESMDTIDLVRHVKEIGFKEAVRWLAKQASLPEPNFNGDLENIHKKQAEFSTIYTYFFERSRENTEKAWEYLKSRSIDPDSVQDLDVGFFPVTYELNDDEREQADKAGLLFKNGNFLFSGAVIFPITRDGEIVGLYGRMHDDIAPRHVYPCKTDPPMPQAIWDMDDCRKEQEVYVTEGIIDAITLRSHGVTNVVAVFGTQGLTTDRLSLLRRSKIRRVNLVFDSDANGSGDKAVLKSGGGLFQAGLVVKVVTLPRPAGAEKMDVNSYFQDHSREDFLSLPCRDYFEVLLDSIPRSEDPQTQFQDLQPVLELISHQPEPTWDHFLENIRNNFPGFSKATLQKEIKKASGALKHKKHKGDKFEPLPYAELIADRYPLIYSGGSFHRYEGGVYQYWHPEELEQSIIEILDSGVKPYELDSVKRMLGALNFKRPEDINRHGLLNLKNGILNLDTGELREHSPSIFSTVQSGVSFAPAAQWPRWKKFLDDVLPDDSLQILLSEIFGYCLTPSVAFHKAFFLLGDGANGKSVVLDILESLLGAENCSALMLSDLNERFRLAELYGKLVNIVQEVEAKSLLADAKFKSVVAGGTLVGERKNQHPFKFRPFAKWVVACNALPASRDRSYGFLRRIVILPFEKTIPVEARNPNLATELIEAELSGILNWAIGGYNHLMENEKFTQPKAVQQALEEYKEFIDPVIMFMREKISSSEDGSTSLKKIYARYKLWCEDNGFKPVSSIALRKSVEKAFQVERKQKNSGVFVPGVVLRD